MRILHLLSQKPAFTGSGTAYKALIEESIRAGIVPFGCFGASKYDKAIYFPGFQNNFEQFIFENNDAHFPIPGMSDIMPYTSSIFNSLSDLQLSQYSVYIKKILSKAIQKFNPEIIWAHHLWILTAIANEISGSIPIMAFCHGTDLLQVEKCPKIISSIRKKIEGVNQVIASSPNQVSEINNYFNIKEKIVYCGAAVRKDLFYVQNEDKSKRHTVRLAYAGKLSKEKGVHNLIYAAKFLLQKGYPITLSLYGEGTKNETEYLKSLASEFKNEIQFKGEVTQMKLAGHLNDTDIFILPSFYEGLGLVALEALCCGCRLIITELPNLISVMPQNLIMMDVVTVISKPNVHGSLDLTDLEPFTNELIDAVSKQVHFVQEDNFDSKKIISASMNSISYKDLFNNLLSLSKKIITF